MKLEVKKESYELDKGCIPCEYQVKIVSENDEDLEILKIMEEETWVDFGIKGKELSFRF